MSEAINYERPVVIDLDAEQIGAHIASLSRRIGERRTALKALRAEQHNLQREIDELRGKRKTWRMFADELLQRGQAGE